MSKKLTKAEDSFQGQIADALNEALSNADVTMSRAKEIIKEELDNWEKIGKRLTS